MARPQRNNVDYFPFSCEEGKKMFYLEETYGNDGFAVFLKLLRELARTDFHYLDLSKKATIMFLSAKCKVSVSVLESIINDLVELEKFDKSLWEENKIIWCQDFINSIQDAYSKRSNECMTYEGLILRLISLGVRKPTKRSSKGGVKPQSIVEYSKEDKTKENNYPTFDDFWELYDKKVSKSKTEKKWDNLSQTEKEKIMDYIPKYKISQPDKKFRKNPETFFNNKSWEDEIIDSSKNDFNQPKEEIVAGRQTKETIIKNKQGW